MSKDQGSDAAISNNEIQRQIKLDFPSCCSPAEHFYPTPFQAWWLTILLIPYLILKLGTDHYFI